MWAVQYHHSGGPDVLVLEDIPRPALRPGQVLVRTLASAVSRIDLLQRRGNLPHGLSFPKQTGFDAIGQVVASRDDSLRPGTWVAVVLGLEPLRGRGTTVEYLAIEPSRCGRFPAGYVPSAEDCTLVLGGLTALCALRDSLRARRGDRLLAVGAGGPVGLAAVQLAGLRGCPVDAVAGPAALERCRDLGADEVYDYHDAQTESLRHSRRYAGAVVAAGEPSAWFGAVRRGGRAALTDGGAWPLSLPAALRAGVRSRAVAAGHDRDDLTLLAGWIAKGDLSPVVGRRYDAADVRRAHAEFGEGGTCGARLVVH